MEDSGCDKSVYLMLMSKNVTRLFEQFAPKHYDISIRLSDDKESFDGQVTIKGAKTGRPSKRIAFHEHGLDIRSAKVLKTDKKGNVEELPIQRINIQKSYDEVRLHFSENIFPGEYTVELAFSGKISKNMEGIYPCFHGEDKNKKIIATQFESHHAREAFPCIDEPEAKATFSLSLTHAANEVALGNTPVKSSSMQGPIATTVFEKTPIMSTYLVAFVVGEIEKKSAKSKSGVEINTYATADQIDNTDFALDTAVKCMDFYEDYYDIPFPLPKCDFVALPDFASGAMENWGLITFREQAMLVDEHTSLGANQWVALVVAHELTHQWFGNLVTMRWWTDLWLNEGFASWMEYLAIDTLYPQWQLWTQFAVDEQQLALKLDSLEHTHPIEVPIKHPDEIRTIFDAISYQKGASVIHMLQDYMGPESFRDGLRHYLKTHSYKNTHTVDLWQALEDVSKKPVKEFMHAWTSLPGFPLVSVNAKNDHLKIKQERFITNPLSLARKDPSLWPVPLLVSGLDRDTIDKRVNNVPFNEPILQLNEGQRGFYRVNYSHEIQAKQLAAIENSEMTAIDRMGLLSDGFEVTKAGYQPISEYLDLLSRFRNEDSLSVWEIIAGSIGTIRATLSTSDEDDELREAMKDFIIGLTAKQLSRLGWEKSADENHLDSLLRPTIIALAAAADEENTVNKALELYEQKISQDAAIDPDLRGIVYATVARKGGEKEFEQLLSMYKNSKSSDERMSLNSALCSFEQPEIHKKVFEIIKDQNIIKLQDISYWIAYSFSNRHSRQSAWKWLKENWLWLKENIGRDLSFSRTPIYAARAFAEESMISEYKQFFAERMEPMLKRSYSQGLEIAETNAAWRKRDAKQALGWFNSKSK